MPYSSTGTTSRGGPSASRTRPSARWIVSPFAPQREGQDLGERGLQALGQLRRRAPKKDVGFRLDVGGRVIPWVTPDDPDAFEAGGAAAPSPRDGP